MSHSATLSWSEAASSDPATGFNIHRADLSAGPFAVIGSSPTSPYVDNTVVGGKTYFYEVTATNAAGESGPSNEVTATITVSLPPAPTGLSIVVA